jgi:hypothetical protein
MKKLVSSLALVAFLFSMSVNAQEVEPKQKKKAKTEKTCSADEKKSCTTEKKAGCCSAKKAEMKS